MTTRPYLQKTIVELRTLFEAAQNEQAELQCIANELLFRTVPKALQLAQEVDERLEAIGSRHLNLVGAEVAGHAQPTSAPSVSRPDPLQADPTPAPERLEMGALPKFATSGRPDDPASILAGWIALEALSPQSFKRPEELAARDRSRVVSLDGPQEPWGPHARGKPNYQLYFQIVLGSIALDKATDRLVQVFGQDEEASYPDGRKAAIGALLVDRNGLLLAENAIAVSSFAWALKPALELKLGALGAWPQVERTIIGKLDDVVRRKDRDGNDLPVTRDVIQAAHRWLVQQLAIPEDLVQPPSFAIKVFHYYRSKTPPEVSLLNSFYLQDLARVSGALADGRAGKGLRQYLGLDRPAEPYDVLGTAAAIEPFVAPRRMPKTRWPSEGGHPLVLLQQAAVNAARVSLLANPGIVGVNGPPGTGKTTLLRDVVAGAVFDRAAAMVGFDDPEKAYSTTGERMGVGGNAFFHFYRLDPSLRGHEVVVASSNNKAVENVSQELPLLRNNGRAGEISYLRSISDLVANPRRAGVEEDDPSKNPVETWGLIAAVLGNGGNRSAFQQTFWWHDDGGYRVYLKAAKGDDVTREIRDPETDKLIRRELPSVVQIEQPPTNPADARSAWHKARRRFQALNRDIDDELKALETIREHCLALPKARIEQAQQQRERDDFSELAGKAAADRAHRDAVERDAAAKGRRANEALQLHRAARPGFFARLFSTQRYKAWAAADERLAAVASTTSAALKQAGDQLDLAARRLLELEARLTALTASLAQRAQTIAQLEAAISEAQARLGDGVIDGVFFGKDHRTRHMTAPWLPGSLHAKREELFGAALAVQRAFVDAAAQKVYHNLNILMNAFTSGALSKPAQRALLGDLWSTLFMVVPVVSTTFASVDRMFGDMGPESLGWLLIDEAGQALPQAAAGAIYRARRSIVVGDPLQIPPVVSLPERLNEEICRFFDIDTDLWSAPTASAQTLADRSSLFQSSFSADTGPRLVGLPLLVHRRCQDPMFSVSNAIAYDNQMVQAVPPATPGPIGTVLGSSRWFDIDGDAETKWCPAEGEVVVRMLRQLARNGVSAPDLFIITPFKVVEQEMRRRVERERELFDVFGEPGHDWAANRIGTIHTFQGREAHSVIMLLGAPRSGQHRARQWAGSPPNIVNVAITRARQHLYVVGSLAAWSGAGTSFQKLISAMPASRVTTV